jgi:ADP-heptose:LPS heptosyltransferase
VEEACKVYAARSLEETREVLLSNERKDLKTYFLKVANRAWVLTANFILMILSLFLFKKRGIKGREFKKIVVYTAGVLGDNSVQLLAIATLKNRYPDAEITVVVVTDSNSKLPSQLFGILPYVDKCVTLNEQIFNGDIGCELFVNLSGAGNIGWFRYVVREMLYAYKMGAKYAIGFSISTHGIKRIFNDIQHNFLENEPRRYQKVLREIGLKPLSKLEILPSNRESKKSILSKLKAADNGVFVSIIPGGTAQVKLWPAERFGALANWLEQEFGARIIVIGNSAEREIGEEIARLSPHSVMNMAGETTIQELIELLRMSRLCITNDTGAMHIAAILRIPTIAIFDTHLPPTWWFPDSDKIIQLFSICECSYCYKFVCDSKKCLNNIEVEHVIQAVLKLLSKNDQGRLAFSSEGSVDSLSELIRI